MTKVTANMLCLLTVVNEMVQVQLIESVQYWTFTGQDYGRQLKCERALVSGKPHEIQVNVYEVEEKNNLVNTLEKCNFGVYHTAICIGYTRTRFSFSPDGVYEMPSNVRLPGLRLKCTVKLGTTLKGITEMKEIIEDLARTKYMPGTYSLVSHNCHTFCEDVSVRLGGSKLPRWVTRIARFVHWTGKIVSGVGNVAVGMVVCFASVKLMK